MEKCLIREEKELQCKILNGIIGSISSKTGLSI